MLEKAKRELEKLRQKRDTDNIFNFFVTAFHIMDYVEKPNLIPPNDRKKFKRNPDFKACAFICNKGKHLTVSKNDKITAVVSRGGAFNAAPWNSTPWNGSLAKCYVDGQPINIVSLAERVIAKWDDFLTAHGL